MSAEKNVALLKAAYRTWQESKGRDADCWLRIMSDSILLRSLGSGRPGLEFSRVRRGKADVGLYLAGMAEHWEMLSYQVDEFIAQKDCVVALASSAWRHRVTGVETATPKADVWRFKNGRIVEFYDFFDTAAIIEAARKVAP